MAAGLVTRELRGGRTEVLPSERLNRQAICPALHDERQNPRIPQNRTERPGEMEPAPRPAGDQPAQQEAGQIQGRAPKRLAEVPRPKPEASQLVPDAVGD